MRAEDLPAVLEIERVAYSTPWPESSFRGLLGRKDTGLFVAEVAPDPSDHTTPPTIAGYAICWAVTEQGELGNIAVAPAWRRRGIARLLLQEVIEAMRALRVRDLFLEVRTSNTGAQDLYREFGFQEIGFRRGYYESPTEDALVMRKGLE
jgi:ribosomal-protein-alanine N-acetyltransferase